MFPDTLREAEAFFHHSFKTIKSRLGGTIDTGTSELALRAARATLAVLEVVARRGWESVQELVVASIEVPDQSIVDLGDLGITLPSNWNQRPAARHAQAIGNGFLAAGDRRRGTGRAIHGVRVPSLVSTSDCNVLLDPRRSDLYTVAAWSRIPFDWLRGTAT